MFYVELLLDYLAQKMTIEDAMPTSLFIQSKISKARKMLL